MTGPSIPKAFEIYTKVKGNAGGILSAISKIGNDVMSINLLLERETDSVLWRGLTIAGIVKPFWTDVNMNMAIVPDK